MNPGNIHRDACCFQTVYELINIINGEAALKKKKSRKRKQMMRQYKAIGWQ